ncbi:MAG: hypothetical protein QF393_13735 [Rhodospirillales bacterium]|nr:hypothetical protein [Rhodospirillales bacterium]MDP6644274.1 hypothetical protein [Rhodospirillales bacterium]
MIFVPVPSVGGEARGYGAWAKGPVEDPAALADVFRRAVNEVEAGNVAVVDVRTML